jgi:hypothetical protein
LASSSAYSGFEGFEVDRAAAAEAGKVATQLLAAVRRQARGEEAGGGGGDRWYAPVGLYTLHSVVTHSLKAPPGFSLPIA